MDRWKADIGRLCHVALARHTRGHPHLIAALCHPIPPLPLPRLPLLQRRRARDRYGGRPDVKRTCLPHLRSRHIRRALHIRWPRRSYVCVVERMELFFQRRECARSWNGREGSRRTRHVFRSSTSRSFGFHSNPVPTSAPRRKVKAHRTPTVQVRVDADIVRRRTPRAPESKTCGPGFHGQSCV